MKIKGRESLSEDTIKRLEARHKQQRLPAYRPQRDWGDSYEDVEKKNDAKKGESFHDYNNCR